MQVERSLLLMQNETFGRIFADVTLDSGKRVSNTWAMYLEAENSSTKVGVILHVPWNLKWSRAKAAYPWKLSP